MGSGEWGAGNMRGKAEESKASGRGMRRREESESVRCIIKNFAKGCIECNVELAEFRVGHSPMVLTNHQQMPISHTRSSHSMKPRTIPVQRKKNERTGPRA